MRGVILIRFPSCLGDFSAGASVDHELEAHIHNVLARSAAAQSIDYDEMVRAAIQNFQSFGKIEFNGGSFVVRIGPANWTDPTRGISEGFMTVPKWVSRP